MAMNLSTLFRSVLLRLSSGCLICLRQGLNDSPTCLPARLNKQDFDVPNNKQSEMDGNSSRTKHVATLLECSIGMLKILSWNNEVRDLKISVEVDHGLSREETPRRILISTADRGEFYCLSGRASVHLQSSSLLSGSRPES